MDPGDVERRSAAERVLAEAAIRRRGRHRRALRRVLMSLAAVALLGCALLSAGTAIELAGDGGCLLPSFQFEVASSERTDSSWLPPSITCRQSFSNGLPDPEVTESRWVLFTMLVPTTATAWFGFRRRAAG